MTLLMLYMVFKLNYKNQTVFHFFRLMQVFSYMVLCYKMFEEESSCTTVAKYAYKCVYWPNIANKYVLSARFCVCVVVV